MAVGKRLRFQIFRRDNFACRYCGLTAADGAVLEVDHIRPKADGGEDVATNLITACEDCNSGKSDIALDAPTVEDVPQADFRAAMKARDSHSTRDPEIAEWVHDLDIAAAVAWHQGFRTESPGLRKTGIFSVSFALAVATGCKAEDIESAAYSAGQVQDADLLAYLAKDEPREAIEEEIAYHEAVKYLAGFIPWEQVRMIWRARAAAGDYCPTIRELTRAAAGQAELYLEEEGRDAESLGRWLNLLPGNEGSIFRMQAAASWDEHWKGRRGHSAHECPDEVLELAISFALGAEAPTT